MPSIISKRTRVYVALVSAATVLSACGGAEARKVRHLAKGQSFLAAGNYEKARVEFQNALQIAPADAEARFENGVVDEKTGKVREAAQFYQSAIDVSPDHLGARTALARVLLFGGYADKALGLIAPSLEKHPDDAELLTLRAAARVQEKDMTGGQADAERAVQLAPTNEDAVSALAGIYMSEKNPDKARELLEDSVRRIPSTSNLRLLLAQVYIDEKRAADAERILIELVHMQPTERGHRIRLAQFYSRENQLDAAEAALRTGIKDMPADRDLKLSLIDFLAAHRGPETAEKELQSMIAAAPKDVEMQFALAKFYVSDHQSERGEKVYRDIIAAQGLDAAGLAARDRLASLRARADDAKGTEQLIGEVLAKSPRDTDALILRGDLELARKDPKAAIADLRSVLRDQPNSVGVLRTLARAHLLNGETAIAEETMRRAVEANPKDQPARLELAQILVQSGKPDQAKRLLEELVKENPNDLSSLNALFRVSAAAKDAQTAKMAADAMVALQPKSPVGYMYQGLLAEEAQQTTEALALYAKSTSLQPDAPEPLQAQVRLLVREKRVPEALKRLDDVIAEAPKSAVAANMKGDLLMSQQDRDGAAKAFKLAIERAPKWWLPYRGLAVTQFAANEPDAALATLRDSQSLVDQPDSLRMEIAAYYERSGKLDKAIGEYEAIVEHNPQFDIAANNLAMLLVTYGKDPASVDRAKALASRFASSSNPSFLDTYGWVLFKHGEAAASVSILERVASQAPNAPVVLYHLGMAQSQSGSTAQAFGNLSRAVNSGAKFSGLEEAKATLDNLAKVQSETNPKT